MQAAQGQDSGTAFVHVAVVPMDRERVLQDQTVIVQGGRITALGPAKAVPVPAGVRRVDGRGKFLIPGLADMHAHVFRTKDFQEPEQTLYAYALNGVTTIRVMGFLFGLADTALTLRARAARGELISPRLYVAAGPVTDTLEVLRAKTAGYDLVKVYGVDGKSLDDIVVVARRVGMPIVGHSPSYDGSQDPRLTPLSLSRAVAAGYASIEHLTGYDLALGAEQGFWWRYWGASLNDTMPSPEPGRQLLSEVQRLLTPPGRAKLRAAATAMQWAGVWNCPTLAMYEATLQPSAARWPEVQYVTDSSLYAWRVLQKHSMAPAVRPAASAAIALRRVIVKTLHDAGAGLLLGTDSPVPFMLPGFAVPRELEAMVGAGLSPYEALTTGTRNVAQYLGTLDSSGTIAVEKRADLVLLRGNPLRDIRYTARLVGVMLGGRWLDPAALDRGLATLKGKLTTMH